MSSYKEDDMVRIVDDERHGDPRTQTVRLDRRAEGEEFPSWADESEEVWIIVAIDDGELFDEGEEDYAKPEEFEVV